MIKVVSYPANFLCAQISDGSISNDSRYFSELVHQLKNSIANSDKTAVYSSNGVTSSFSLVHQLIVLDRLIYKMFVVLDGGGMKLLLKKYLKGFFILQIYYILM